MYQCGKNDCHHSPTIHLSRVQQIHIISLTNETTVCNQNSLEMDPLLYQIPPRPFAKDNPYTNQHSFSSLPHGAARLRFALDRGLFPLAEAVTKVHRLLFSSKCWIETEASPFFSDIDHLPAIACVLHGISRNALKLMITRQLHMALRPVADPKLRLPFQHPHLVVKGKPVVYARIHCSLDGQLPTKHQYLNVLADMAEYNRAPQDGDSESREARNKLAYDIDNVSPGIALGTKETKRNWTPSTSAKWLKSPNPRRYGNHAPKNIKEIDKFIQSFRQQLQSVPEHQSLEHSLVYVGWTQMDTIRKTQHDSHLEGSAVA